MMTSWRVVRENFATRAFDGEGARVWGGRWHSAGRAVVYTSATTSLGLLEKMVHTDEGVRIVWELDTDPGDTGEVVVLRQRGLYAGVRPACGAARRTPSQLAIPARSARTPTDRKRMARLDAILHSRSPERHRAARVELHPQPQAPCILVA